MPYIEDNRDKIVPLLQQLAEFAGEDNSKWTSILLYIGENLVKENVTEYYENAYLGPLGTSQLIVLEKLTNILGKTAGNYNYTYTWLAHKFILERKLCYATINSLVGTLHLTAVKVHSRAKRFGGRDYENGLMEFVGMFKCMFNELYTVVIYPYEQSKRKLNGPVSTLDALYYKLGS